MDNYALVLISFFISLLVMTAFVFFAVSTYKRKLKNQKTLNPFWIIAIGIFISAAVLFFPTYYLEYFEQSDGVFEKILKSFSLSIHNTMRLFVLDGDFDAFRDIIVEVSVDRWFYVAYSIYSVILFVCAPIMTAGVVLTFFKNASAYISYYFSFKNEIYYFNELNEKSMTLAENIRNAKGKKSLIVFTDVDFSEENDELYYRVRSLGAVCFNGKEIADVSLKRFANNVVRKFYFISNNQDDNVEQALTMIEKLKNDDVFNNHNSQLYVFATTAVSSILLDNADNGNLKVRRVHESKNLIYSILKDHSIFDDAIEENGVKKINALILGVGEYGRELFKAICWCGQMVGYETTVRVLSKERNLAEKIEVECPELLKYNDKKIDGEAYYNVVFHENIDVNTSAFRKELAKMGKITTAYAMLGDDELNLNASIAMREEFGRLNGDENKKTSIFAIVESPEKNETIINNGGLKDYTGASYDVELIGDLKTEYSLEVIEQQELENKGLKCHLKWSQTSEDIEKDTIKYDNFEYFRRASIAEALYSELRVKLGVTLGDADSENSEKVIDYEHRRWNAYMRTEGYVYGKVKSTIYKTHPSLIPYKSLSQSEKKKDEVVLQASENND